LRVKNSGFRFQGSEIRVQGVGCRGLTWAERVREGFRV